MAKKDDIILIIAKSFARQYLTSQECKTCKSLTHLQLIADHGLNDIQASKVINWCVISTRNINKKDLCEETNEKDI